MNALIPAGGLQEGQDAPEARRRALVAQLALAPFQARSYTNLVYLLLAFPLGMAYFVFLITGLSLSLGLMITILGLPILGLILLGSWWLAALERRLAIGLLGAAVPPMGTAPFQTGQGFRRDVEEFLGNRVTWTGMIFLALKFPLSLITFVATVTLVALSMSFLLVPFLYPLSFIEWDGVMLWWVDSPAEAGLCFLLGILLTYVSLFLLNGLAMLWKAMATAMLGSERYAVQPSPPAPLPQVGEGGGLAEQPEPEIS
ncbi:MAG TPA: sensor domain-containing protein [Thermoanaerobaculia bacterium]|nr:sensor domain-containing protein [Thermoanaerobaculia bacterium]